jgi:hypothetical protein
MTDETKVDGMTLEDRVEFALRDAGFDYDEASHIAQLAARSAMRVDDARLPREWVEAAYAAFLRINDDDSDKAKTDLGTWAIGTHAALQAAIGGKE